MRLVRISGPTTEITTPWHRTTLVSLTIAAILILLLATPAPRAHADPPERFGALEALGSFAVKENAEALTAKLETQGEAAFIMEKLVEGQVFYTVYHDRKPHSLVSKALKDKEALATEITLQQETVSEPVTVEPMVVECTPGIVLQTDTTIFNSPSEEATALGTYSSLGGGKYLNKDNGYYILWLNLLKRYGYVKSNDAAGPEQPAASTETEPEEPEKSVKPDE